MGSFYRIARAAERSVALISLLLLGGLLIPSTALADGGIAISGSFSQQDFQIPQGSSVSGPSIDVVVFNNSSDQVSVRMSSQAPVGVNIGLSKTEMTIPAGGQQQVLVSVEVTKDAAPGQYDISVAAETYKAGVGGIQLSGAARQSAKLTVVGDSASVTVQAVSPEGKPLVATIRLNRVISGRSLEVAYSEKGILTATVAPGSFVTTCSISGRSVAEQSFQVAANEKKQVTLTAATVYFEGFGLVPNTQQDTGKIASVQVVYSVRNLYQRVDKGEIILVVSRNGAQLQSLPLATLSPLEMGSVGLNYNYVPAGGWVDGNYDFQLQLKLDGKNYAESAVEHLPVNSGGPAAKGTAPASAGASGGGMNPMVWVGAGAILLVAAVVVVLVGRRKKA